MGLALLGVAAEMQRLALTRAWGNYPLLNFDKAGVIMGELAGGYNVLWVLFCLFVGAETWAREG